MATVIVNPGNTLIVSAPGPQGPAGSGPGGGVTDGDKGDLTVSGGGTVYTIDADAVTFDKLQNVTGPALLGRQAATSGSAEAITLGSGLTIDGSKQLTISASYAQQSVTMTAGTGLTGGGDLSASRTFAVSYGSTASTACEGNDARLSDARTPTAHTHALADIQQGGATSGQVLEWSGSAWAPATPSGGGGGGAPPVNKKYVVFEHFINNATTPDRMTLAGSLSPVTLGVGIADIRADGRVGGVNLTTGTTASANQHTTWRMANSTSIADFQDLASAQYTTEIKGLNLADGTTTGIVYVGLARFSSTPGSDPSHGVYFRSTDGGNWYAVTRASGTETATDTGVGTNTTAWQRLTVKYTSSSCTFYIDGTLEATHTTNIPTLEANFGMSIVKTAAVSSQIRYTVDWLYGDLEYDPALSLD